MQPNVFHDTQYLNLMQDILDNGRVKSDRTGTGTRSAFERHMRFDLRDGTIPLLTTKKMHLPSILHELLWYLSGSSNIKYLQDNNVRIWNEWADNEGNLGKVYGAAWRHWDTPNGELDQLTKLIHDLKTNPTSRRLIVTAWNPAILPPENVPPRENPAKGLAALPPCHYTFLCYTTPLTLQERMLIATQQWNMDAALESGSYKELIRVLDDYNVPKYELSLALKQRSCDVFLGVPYNISQYSILMRIIADIVNMVPGEFCWNGTDVHLYSNHTEQATEQLQRTPYASPSLRFARRLTSIDDIQYNDFIIENYQCHSTIKAPVAV